jgi:hypothetical protein
MISDARRLSRRLAEAGVADPAVVPEPIPGGRTGFVMPLDERDPSATWAAARSALPDTGRWPLLAQSTGDDFYHRGAYRDSPGSSTDQTPAAIVRRAADIDDPDDYRRIPRAWSTEQWSQLVDRELDYTKAYCGTAPRAAEILAQVPQADEEQLDRLLFAFEQAHRPTVAATPLPPRYTPFSVSEAKFMHLLPTADAAAVPAYTHFWGCVNVPQGPERLIGLLRRWLARFAAETFAATGVTLAFHVRRPPATMTAAYRLAREQHPFVKVDERDRRFARLLLEQRVWELYNRP